MALTELQAARWRMAGVAYYKHQQGDHMTDEELRTAIDAFEDIVPKLYSLGPVFLLPAMEAQRIALNFRDYSENRKRFAKMTDANRREK